MRSWRITPTIAVMAALACGQDQDNDAEPQVVVIATSDYAFVAPDEVPAGLVTFRMEAGGHEFHHAQIVRFEEGKTLADFVELLSAGEMHPPSWVRHVGGPNGADPGSAAEVTVFLEPGSYALLCYVPSPDGIPHMAKGMMKSFTVTGTAQPVERPSADVVMRLVDYAYDISGTITAGSQTILVETTSEQPHEVVIVRLEPGKTAMDVVQWVEGGLDGPPPGQGLAGTAALDRGEWNLVHAEFEPGDYALLCFIPDHQDGAPHVAHGMVAQITVE